MNKTIFSVLVFIFLGSFLLIYGYEKTDKENIQLGAGLERVKVDGFEIVVPKGAKITKKGGILTAEGIEGYAGRKFKNLEERIFLLELKYEELKKEIAQMKERQ